MAYIEKKIIQGTLLTDSGVTYYTASTKTIIKELTFCNTDTSTSVTFTLYIVPAGGEIGDSNMEFNEIPLNAKETQIYGRTCVLEIGDSIQVLASTTNKIAFSCSGVERT
jgi:hypothetical protein